METGYTWKEVSQCQGQESDQQLLPHHTVRLIDVTKRRNGTSYAQINEIDSVGLGLSSAIYCLCNLRKGFPGVSDGKKSACSGGDCASIPGLGRSPGEGNSKSCQYSCLENSMDREARQATVHGVTKRWT